MHEFYEKQVMVVGMARSGIAAARLLLALGARVMLYDAKPQCAFDLGDLPAHCECLFEQDPLPAVERMDALVLSPGVPTRLPFIQRAYALKKRVLAEIELGYLVAQADFVCISGTNGKTTTTALTGELFKNAGRTTYVLGNIGTPICEAAMDTRPGDVIVAETAALQLETIGRFRPRACALLNITEDHLDRFGTMEYYTACKMRMFENQTEEDFAVLNWDDPLTRAQAKKITRAQLFWFSRKCEMERGAFLRGDRILFKSGDCEADICAADEVKIPGAHNLENALAAVALAMCMGVSAETVAHTLKTFPGVEHRIEFVREVGGVRFINDSKGTNPDATIKAIEAMRAPTVLILGGYDKHSSFDGLFAAFTPDIEHVVLLGQTRQKLLQAAQAAGFDKITLVDTLAEAVPKAYALAKPGGNVLLSPACASWDQFDNFEQRGEVFKALVNTLR